MSEQAANEELVSWTREQIEVVANAWDDGHTAIDGRNPYRWLLERLDAEAADE
jgi:hypothetical protein